MRRHSYAVPTLVLAVAATGCAPFGASSGQHSAAAPASVTTTGRATTGPTTAAPARVRSAGKALTAGAVSLTAAGSAKVDGTIVTRPTGAGAQVTLHFAGKERWSPSQAGDLTLTGAHVGDAAVGTVRMLTTSKAVYLKLPLIAALSPAPHKDWAKISFSNATSFGGLDLGQYAGRAQQLQPRQYLAILATSANVAAVGTLTIDGVRTRHYRGTVDLPKALASLSDVPQVWTRLATSQGLKSLHVDAWLDAGNRPRKITMTAGSALLTLTLTLHLSAYGVPVQVALPSADRTLDLTHGLLGALG